MIVIPRAPRVAPETGARGLAPRIGNDREHPGFERALVAVELLIDNVAEREVTTAAQLAPRRFGGELEASGQRFPQPAPAEQPVEAVCGRRRFVLALGRERAGRRFQQELRIQADV